MVRPAGVTILAVISFIAAFGLGCSGFFTLVGGAFSAIAGSVPGFIAGLGATIVAGVLFGLAAVYFVNGIGLVKLRDWARTLTIVLLIFSFVMAALGALSALAHFRIFLLLWQVIVGAIDLWILKYLNSSGVKAAFRAAALQ
jgi:uncharacterized membrane protein